MPEWLHQGLDFTADIFLLGLPAETTFFRVFRLNLSKIGLKS